VTSSKAKTENHRNLNAIFFWGFTSSVPGLSRVCPVPLMDLKLGLEYRDVALRSEQVRASALSKREILELIEAMEAFAEPVEVVMKTRPLSPDPNDDMILDLAINGRAEALLTSNTKHFAGAGKRFGIPVLSPAEFLEKMR
jgi:hypothetical protein